MAWLQLARIALLPTILWDFHAGLLLADLRWDRHAVLALLSLLAIYHGGMMLNDLRDVAVDRAAGRRRPLVDGRISPIAAGIAILVAFAGALTLASFTGPWLPTLAAWLLGIVVLYDLCGADLRRHFGPALLAAARGFSLCFAAFAVFGFEEARIAIGTGPIAGYALYFLFLSRLAQSEESGIHGLNGLSFLLMGAVAPAILFYDGQPAWWFLPAWIAFAFYLLRPAIAKRHDFWEPEVVQSMVRHSLGSAPLVPGLCLLADGDGSLALQALLAIPVCLVVRQLARRWAPE